MKSVGPVPLLWFVILLWGCELWVGDVFQRVTLDLGLFLVCFLCPIFSPPHVGVVVAELVFVVGNVQSELSSPGGVSCLHVSEIFRIHS